MSDVTISLFDDDVFQSFAGMDITVRVVWSPAVVAPNITTVLRLDLQHVQSALQTGSLQEQEVTARMIA